MRSIKDLLGQNEVIWFSVGSDGTRFLQELSALNIPWVDGTPVTEDDQCSYFMGISANRRVGHINWRIWRASWLNEGQVPGNRMHYGKYSRGENDYLVHENIVKEIGGFIDPLDG